MRSVILLLWFSLKEHSKSKSLSNALASKNYRTVLLTLFRQGHSNYRDVFIKTCDLLSLINKDNRPAFYYHYLPALLECVTSMLERLHQCTCTHCMTTIHATEDKLDKFKSSLTQQFLPLSSLPVKHKTSVLRAQDLTQHLDAPNAIIDWSNYHKQLLVTLYQAAKSLRNYLSVEIPTGKHSKKYTVTTNIVKLGLTAQLKAQNLEKLEDNTSNNDLTN